MPLIQAEDEDIADADARNLTTAPTAFDDVIGRTGHHHQRVKIMAV